MKSEFSYVKHCVTYTVWKIQDFPATQILREIKSGDFRSPKTAILTLLKTHNFEIFGLFTIFKHGISPKIKIHANQIGENCTFWAPKVTKSDFT